VVGNITFLAEQARNNPDFVCGNGGIGCMEEADVMLVLDRSGSIDAGEMTTMKNAAKAFVDALAPSTGGVHVGMVSFSSSATLDQVLTDDGTTVKTAIDNIPSPGSGLTNLEDGIRTAQLELDTNGRAGVAKFMVIITDGEPTASDGPGTNADDAEDAATDSKNAGTEIFAVGVGIGASGAAFLQNDIVSAPSANHYFNATDFDDLEAILEDLVDCPNGQLVSP